MSQIFASGGQSIEASAAASVLPMNIQGWFSLGFTGLISLLSKGLLRGLQHHSSKASILRRSAFFTVQLSQLYVTTGKTMAVTIWTMIHSVLCRGYFTPDSTVFEGFCCYSVAQSCPTLCDPMDCSRPGFPVHHQLPELAQTHVHWVSDTIEESYYLQKLVCRCSCYKILIVSLVCWKMTGAKAMFIN